MLKYLQKKTKREEQFFMEFLKQQKFNNQTELIKFLQDRYTFKVDKDKELIYIIDKTNPDRKVSKDFVIKEDKNKKLYLSEI